MRNRATILIPLLAVLGAPAAEAKYCAADEVPAATLLLPYFEVDLEDPSGFTTLFSVNNALATAGVAHVTLWTDWAIPTINFDIYLTGYDVQTINLRDVFNASLPLTGSDGQDPNDTFSPQGFLSEDVDFASCSSLPYSATAFGATLRSELRLAHAGGNAAAIFGGCLSENHGDGRVRGYVTIDAAKACSFDPPSSPDYFTDVASNENRLWGTVTYVDAANNSAQQESLVHIEACSPENFGQTCPTGGDRYTFYGRYVNFDGSDEREALPTTFHASFLNGGTFSGGTRLIVWRDSKRGVSGFDGAAPCLLHRRPSWYPLDERDVVSFDEEENPEDHCVFGNVIIPPPNPAGCFPLATQQVALDGSSASVTPLVPAAPFGWLHLDLNPLAEGTEPQPGRAQAWVVAIASAAGRFSTAVSAVHLDSACSAAAGPVLIP
jgi:hypothetical protein